MKLPITLLALVLPLSAWAQTQSVNETACGSLHNPAIGPYDYRAVTRDIRNLVEGAHFTPGVENFTAKMNGEFGHDIGYTLRAFPNHARALAAMQRLSEKEKRDKPVGSPYIVECYFERGLRFMPNDRTVRLLYVNFLISKGRTAEISKHLEFVASLSEDDPFMLYNVGMLYFDAKDYALALKFSHRAMALGLNRDGLKRRLQEVNQWAEPPSEASPAASSATAASSAEETRQKQP